MSPQDQGIVCKLLTAHQIAQTVVAVQIHGAVAAIGLRDAVNLSVAGVGIGQGGTVLVDDGLGPAKIVIGEAGLVAVDTGLHHQQAAVTFLCITNQDTVILIH